MFCQKAKVGLGTWDYNLISTLISRSAGIQQRIGPEYAGPLGIIQALVSVLN
jgi:NADH:ubiquinone oxidoreductase subunit H